MTIDQLDQEGFENQDVPGITMLIGNLNIRRYLLILTLLKNRDRSRRFFDEE